MRYLSRLFQPVITIPKDAKIKNTEITCKSQKLLLECGLIRPTGAGFFTILPLAKRAIDKLELLIRTCIESAGGQRISLPSLTLASLWEKTGRLAEVGTELMMTQDRHGKRYLLAPTHEEAIADLLSDVGPLSYKQLPLLLYQVGHTFILGDKYSAPLSALVTEPGGAQHPVIMSCYGIGVTRLLEASLEALSSDKCLRWPRAIAPYNTIIIGPKEGSKEWQAVGWDAVCQLYEEVRRALGADDVLIDDRHTLTIGKRLMMADRIGYPNIIVCGRSLQDSVPRYELYSSQAATAASVQLVTKHELLDLLGGKERELLRNIS